MASSAFFPHSIAAIAACAPDPQASLAAMECGKNAEEAILVASRVDQDTGMGYDSYTF
jgi:hypothetical protein